MSLRVVVIGTGSIGRRHLENLRELGCEVSSVSRTPGEERLGSLEEAEAWAPDAVVIATPTSEHVSALRWAVERGIHAYVEKPLVAYAEGVAELLDEADAAGVVVATGYNLRFHPALEAVRVAVTEGRIGRLFSVRAEVGQYLPDWHPREDYRVSYVARRELGGGALLTLSHELDYVRWIAGEVVSCRGVVARVSSLELDVDDVAELVCRHERGVLSSVHVDLVDRSYNRRSRWVGEEGTISWAWGGPVLLLPGNEMLWADDAFDLSSTYQAALSDFVACSKSGGRPRASGRDGLRVVELCAGASDAL